MTKIGSQYMTYDNLPQQDNEINIQKNLTPEVEAVGEMHFEGNVIPHLWYHNIKFKNGMTDLVSICILAEIVYWYRPTYVRDEGSANLIAIKKKFHSDILQKNKEQLAKQLGLTERQVKDSLFRLEQLGVIKREFRTIEKDGFKLPNVAFIKLNPFRLKQLTFSKLECDVSTSDRVVNQTSGGYDVETSGDVTSKRHTNTETTKHIDIKKNKKKESSASPPQRLASDEASLFFDFFNEELEKNFPKAKKIMKTEAQVKHFQELLDRKDPKTQKPSFTFQEIKKIISYAFREYWAPENINTPGKFKKSFDKVYMAMTKKAMIPKGSLSERNRKVFQKWYEGAKQAMISQGIEIIERSDHVSLNGQTFYFNSETFTTDWNKELDKIKQNGLQSN